MSLDRMSRGHEALLWFTLGMGWGAIVAQVFLWVTS